MSLFEFNEDDPSIITGEDGKRYHVPGHYKQKVAFLAFSILVVLAGMALSYHPFIRLIAGETAIARVDRIIRQESGRPDEIIRYRKTIPAGNINVRFAYYVIVELESAGQKTLRMAIDSRREPYANINDEFEVIFFPEEDFAYGLYHLRTWAFGAGFIFTGLLLTLCAVPTLLAVGKPIEIDPEAPEEDQ